MSSSSSSSREDSPDWLRSFQAPVQSAAVTLSSGSSSPLGSDDDEISLTKLLPKEEQAPPGRNSKRKLETAARNQGKTAEEQVASEKPVVSSEPNHSVWALSSDSDSLHDSKPVTTDILHDAVESSQNHQVLIEKPPKKKLKKEIDKLSKAEKVDAHKHGENAGNMDLEEKTAEKCTGLYVTSSRLPLMLVEKLQRTKALVECEGDSIDLSGDVGAVGRVVISDDSSGNQQMLLDLKGTIYQTSIIPSRTFCVVSFGQSEAKIEAIMDDFIQLKPQANVYEAETMVEGTLDGFSFDSEEEMDNLPKPIVTNQGEGEGENEQPKGKTKQKAGKASSAGQKKKIKAAGGKKGKKKSQAAKKSKTKK